MDQTFSTQPGAPLVIKRGGRFFINMGRPGFNCRANNGAGFSSREAAEQASAKFAMPGLVVRVLPEQRGWDAWDVATVSGDLDPLQRCAA